MQEHIQSSSVGHQTCARVHVFNTPLSPSLLRRLLHYSETGLTADSNDRLKYIYIYVCMYVYLYALVMMAVVVICSHLLSIDRQTNWQTSWIIHSPFPKRPNSETFPFLCVSRPSPPPLIQQRVAAFDTRVDALLYRMLLVVRWSSNGAWGRQAYIQWQFFLFARSVY